MPRKLTDTTELARILWEEFERDGWGDIDPYQLELIAEGHVCTEYDCDTECHRDTGGMRMVLCRVLDRINALS